MDDFYAARSETIPPLPWSVFAPALIFASDPRNQYQATQGMSVGSGQFSLWPDAPGLAASGDVNVARAYADTARQEYRAVGISMAFSPQADIATEPRWGRISGTFGDDPDLVRRMTKAEVEGFQHGDGGLTPESVASVAKHWVGYGAEPNGFDAHNPYGNTLAFPGKMFETHIGPFLGAFDAKVASVMPAYPKPPADLIIDGKPAEQVGFGFSRQMIEGLLRARYHFNGVVLTDWQITDDCTAACEAGTTDLKQMGMPWGVETLSKIERFEKALSAGVDQFGGVENPEIIEDLVRSKRVSMKRIDVSVERLLVQKFQLGLFENPFVDEASAAKVVGSKTFMDAGMDAQRRSLVLLKNDNKMLPLGDAKGRKVWLYNVSPAVAKAYGFVVVDTPAAADLAIIRIAAPFEQNHKQYFFGNRQHEGSLEFKPDNPDLLAVETARDANIPSVVSVYLERPAILTPIVPLSSALVGNFGVSDDALFDVITGRASISGHLPFELPSSEASVEEQKPDVPHDSKAPLFDLGYGLTY